MPKVKSVPAFALEPCRAERREEVVFRARKLRELAESKLKERRSNGGQRRINLG